MALNNSPEIVTYDNIITSYEVINGWKDPAVFPVQNASVAERIVLDKAMATEIIFEGTGGNSIMFEPLFERVFLYLKKMLNTIDKPVFIFKSEFKSQKTNRVRSYKGIIPKGMEKTNYIQYETMLPSTYSIIGALVRLTEDNFWDSIDLFADSSNSFILSTVDQTFFLSETINNILSSYMVHGSVSYLNYLKRINYYCLRGDVLFRLGGDGGDRYVSIQAFSLRQQKGLILRAAATVADNWT